MFGCASLDRGVLPETGGTHELDGLNAGLVDSRPGAANIRSFLPRPVPPPHGEAAAQVAVGRDWQLSARPRSTSANTMAFCSGFVARPDGPTDRLLFACCQSQTHISVRRSVGFPRAATMRRRRHPPPHPPPAPHARRARCARARGRPRSHPVGQRIQYSAATSMGGESTWPLVVLGRVEGNKGGRFHHHK